MMFTRVIFTALLSCSAALQAKDPNGENWSQGKKVEFDDSRPQKDADVAAQSAVTRISRDIQTLKKEVIALNKDLRTLEENMLFPSNTRFTVFVTVNSGRFFELESVKIKLDGRLVSSHIYSGRQRGALLNGGVQKLYVTNLSEGRHRLTAFFTGLGANSRVHKRATNLEFDKGQGSQYVEILVTDDEAIQEPVFTLKQW